MKLKCTTRPHHGYTAAQGPTPGAGPNIAPQLHGKNGGGSYTTQPTAVLVGVELGREECEKYDQANHTLVITGYRKLPLQARRHQ